MPEPSPAKGRKVTAGALSPLFVMILIAGTSIITPSYSSDEPLPEPFRREPRQPEPMANWQIM